MAISAWKTTVFSCDRCQKTAEVTEDNPSRLSGYAPLPDDWATVANLELCPPCVAGLRDYLAKPFAFEGPLDVDRDRDWR